MTYLAWALVIFLTALLTILGTAWLTGRGDKLERTKLQARLEEGMGRVQPSRAGRLRTCCDTPPGCSHQGTCPNSVMMTGEFLPDVNEPPPFQGASLTGKYGPFPVDTGPLLILSEQAAANVALEREIEQRCAEAEAKIPPRWR